LFYFKVNFKLNFKGREEKNLNVQSSSNPLFLLSIIMDSKLVFF